MTRTENLPVAPYLKPAGTESLQSLLGHVACSLRVDTIQLGIDLGSGYRRDCFIGQSAEVDPVDSTDSPFVIMRESRIRRPANPSGLVAAPERLDQRILLVGTAGRRNAPRSGIALLRSPARAAFKPGERRRIAELLPQINHALALACELESARRRESSAFAMLEHAHCGCLLLSPEGQILHGNRLAFELLEQACIHAGQRLRLPTPLLQRRFDEALARAAAPGCHAVSSLQIPGSPLLTLSLHPAAPAGGALPAPLTLILRSQRTARLHPCAAQHFGLTPAEFKLCAALVDGASLKSCAHAWNRSYDTLRSQLKTILAKTGTHRQAELVGLLNAFSASA